MRTFRFVEVGMAAALAAVAVTAVGLVQSVGAQSSTASSYVPIVPCRLVDTRPGSDNVGGRAGPVGPGEVATFAVWGTNGNCTIPSSATGIATNVTAVNPTASSYITIYPSDANPRPAASNLNVIAGGAPTPNQVTVGLSTTGAISAYNNGGTVDLLIDIVGYYQPASTGTGTQGSPGKDGANGKDGADGKDGNDGTNGQPCPTNGCTVFYTGIDMVPVTSSTPGVVNSYLCLSLPPSPGAYGYLPLNLPAGAAIKSVRVRYSDTLQNGGGTGYELVSFDEAFTYTNRSSTYATVSASINQAQLQLNAALPAQSRTVQYELVALSHAAAGKEQFCGAEVTYTL